MCLIKLWKIFRSKSSSCKLNNRALCYVIKISLVLKLHTAALKRRVVVSTAVLLKMILFSPKQNTIILEHKTQIKLALLLNQVSMMKMRLSSKSSTLNKWKTLICIVGFWSMRKKLFPEKTTCLCAKINIFCSRATKLANFSKLADILNQTRLPLTMKQTGINYPKHAHRCLRCLRQQNYYLRRRINSCSRKINLF